MKYCPECSSELQHRIIDNVERLVCISLQCGFIHWNNPIPVVAGLIQYGDKYVLARNAKWPSGMFSLITGFLEKDETPEQAILRETKEELGIAGERLEFIGYYSLFELNQLILAFAVQGHGNLTPSDEIAEVQVLSRSELANFDFGRFELTSKIVVHWLQLPNIAFERDAPKAARSSTLR